MCRTDGLETCFIIKLQAVKGFHGQNAEGSEIM